MTRPDAFAGTVCPTTTVSATGQASPTVAAGSPQFDISPRRRSWLHAGLAMVGAGAIGTLGGMPRPAAAQAGAYPTRTITLVSPFVAGGPNDIIGRLIAEPLREALGQPVVVDNASGAGGLIGTQKVLSAPADGYLLLIGAAYLPTAPFLFKAARFDAANDLIPLSAPIESQLVFVAGPQADLQTLFANARRTGTPLRIANPGTGTLSHLGAELLRLEANVPAVQVPYRGVGPGLTDLMGGQVDLMLDALPTSLPLVRSGKLKALCVPEQVRNPLLPDVPTTTELGWGAVQVRAWNALFARTGTPAAIVERLRAELTKIVASTTVRDGLSKRGLEVGSGDPSAFRQRIVTEAARWNTVIQRAGISIE